MHFWSFPPFMILRLSKNVYENYDTILIPKKIQISYICFLFFSPIDRCNMIFSKPGGAGAILKTPF